MEGRMARPGTRARIRHRCAEANSDRGGAPLDEGVGAPQMFKLVTATLERGCDAVITIAVCAKLVYDPEAPVSLFKVDKEEKHVLPPSGTPLVVNPFDENALETALRIKDSTEARIAVFSVGYHLAAPILKRMLAAGADELVLLDDKQFCDLDGHSTAAVLACAIERYGGVDLVLCGRQAADTNAGQVGLAISRALGMPVITRAAHVDIDADGVCVRRLAGDGSETIRASLPAVVTVSNEAGDLRLATTRAQIAARKKGATIVHATDLGIDVQGLRRTNMLRVRKHEHTREAACKMLEMDELADVLRGKLFVG